MFWPFRKARPLGPRGEDLAARFLRRRGMKLLARNYRCDAGEIDLIVLDRHTRGTLGGETIAFVEVKTRCDDRYSRPEAAVDAHKQGQVRRAASHYLARHNTEGYRLRYDVVSIVLRDGEKPRIDHLPDAF